jgi:endonuclease III
MSNSDNPKRGAVFQKQVVGWFKKEYGVKFELEKKIPIGNPAKDHKFDIVDMAGTIAIECKRYTWTETGNVPSAKIGFTNEAAFYLTFLPDSYEKYIVMLKSQHPKRKESLAEYYFRINHHLLGKIKVAEYDPEKNEIRIVGQNDFSKEGNYLVAIRSFLESKGLGYDTSLTAEIEKRKAGKHYLIQDHIRGMVYSMLTNQTKWYRVEPYLPEIDKLFYDYDPEKILAAEPEYFCQGILNLKCGNMSTKAQMEALSGNIQVFQRVEEEFGNIDAFITSEPADVIVEKLSNRSSPYKMKMLGEALAWEYLRNVGIDGAKPDTHLRRFLGSDRMGTGEHSPATVSEVNEQVARLSEAKGISKVEIDNLIWSFCADGFGEICTAAPHCTSCPIRDWCRS